MIFKRSLIVLGLTIVGFVLHSRFGLQSATIAMTGGVVAMLACHVNPEEAMKEVDLDTLFFFMGLFILVGGMEMPALLPPSHPGAWLWPTGTTTSLPT